MAVGAVSLRKSHDIVILSFCNIVKGQANCYPRYFIYDGFFRLHLIPIIWSKVLVVHSDTVVILRVQMIIIFLALLLIDRSCIQQWRSRIMITSMTSNVFFPLLDIHPLIFPFMCQYHPCPTLLLTGTTETKLEMWGQKILKCDIDISVLICRDYSLSQKQQ